MNNKHLLVAVVAWLSFVLLSVPQSIYGADHSGEKLKIRSISIIEENKFRFTGDGEFKGKSIEIASSAGEKLTAAYSPAEKMFVTPDGKRLTPGVVYTIKANWALVPNKQTQVVIPALVSAKQTGSNQVALVFDRPVDAKRATDPGSYWIRKNADTPADIATIGKNDPLTRSSALTAFQAVIQPLDHTGKSYVIKFHSNIEPGARYTVLPCFLTIPGGSGYEGGNTLASGHNTFIGQVFQ